MLHTVSYMREQAELCIERHRGDGLAPLVLDLCNEVDLLRARFAHALLYVNDDDQALATTLPGDVSPDIKPEEPKAPKRSKKRPKDLGKSSDEDA